MRLGTEKALVLPPPHFLCQNPLLGFTLGAEVSLLPEEPSRVPDIIPEIIKNRNPAHSFPFSFA